MSTISRRQFLATAALSLGTMGLVACGGASSGDTGTDAAADAADEYTLVNEGKLTCISNLYFPPFESMDETTGEPVGFDIDVSKALAEHMGLEVNWLPSQAFDSLVPTIKAGGTADIAIAGMTITDARKAEVDMSDPYVDSNQSVVTKVGSEDTLDTLNAEGKKIAVQAGTTGADWATENLPNATIVPLDDIISAMNGVLTGSYDGLVTDLPVAGYQIKNSFTDLQILEPIPTGEQYGIAVSKDNPGLTAAINQALADMEADGTMAAIETEWFGAEV
jgi:polar amino acid transport system substrate-binding protein